MEQAALLRKNTIPAAPCGDFRPDSDIDILVEFEPGARIGFFELVTMEPELTDLFGRQADLCTPEELSRYFRQKVLDQAQVLYERTG